MKLSIYSERKFFLEPLVSIIMPVYNVSAYLDTALTSVFNQTYSNYELICVNDGSIDCSLQILKDYHSKIKNMRIINQSNGGLSVARNTGYEQASGKYIYYFDPDDIMLPELLSQSVEMMEQFQLNILQFDVDTFFDGIAFDKTRVLSSYKNIEGVRDVLNIDTFLNQISADEFRAPVWQFMYRKDFLDEHHLYFEPGILWEDLLFSPITVCEADKIGLLKEKLYRYRIRQGSITTTIAKNSKVEQRRKWSSMIIIQKLSNYLSSHHLSQNRAQFITNRLRLLLVNFARDYGMAEMKALKLDINIRLKMIDYLRICKNKLNGMRGC